jgi:hypothetical protein
MMNTHDTEIYQTNIFLEIYKSIRKIINFPVINTDSKNPEYEPVQVYDVLFGPVTQRPANESIFICFGCEEALKARIFLLDFGPRVEAINTCKICRKERNFGFEVSIYCYFCCNSANKVLAEYGKLRGDRGTACIFDDKGC